MSKKSDDIGINEKIRADKIRLISSDGKQLGIMTLREALELASKESLDLVEVAPNSDPPVCRILDYGKYKYQISKKQQEGKKKSKAFQLKEIRLRPHTEEHDLGFKIKNLKKFLEKKDRVKVTIVFRGREMSYIDMGFKLMERITQEIADLGTVEQPPAKEGLRLTMIIVPS